MLFQTLFSNFIIFLFISFISFQTHKQYEEMVRRQQTDDTNRLLARHQQEENDLKQSAENELNELKQLQVSYDFVYLLYGCWFVCDYRTTLRFDFLHSFMVCTHCYNLWYTESWKFRILNCACSINTKPNGKQKQSEERKKKHFCWLVTSLPMYLKNMET